MVVFCEPMALATGPCGLVVLDKGPWLAPSAHKLTPQLVACNRL